jgi:hypothetical protein
MGEKSMLKGTHLPKSWSLRFIAPRAVLWGVIALLPATAGLDCEGAGNQQTCNTPLSGFSVDFTNSTANANTSAFQGEFTTQPSGSNTMIMVHQTLGGIERKFIVIVSALQGTYDLSSTYMSYTEITSDNANVWKATGGTLTFESCGDGTLLIHTNSGGAQMSPFATGNTNQATGSFTANVFCRTSV